MQKAVFGPYALQKRLQKSADAFLVDPAHVADTDAVADQQVALGIIDRANTEDLDILRFQGVFRRAAKQIVKSGQAAQKRERRAVKVAAGGAVQRVKIRMRIEPKHEQRAPECGCRPCLTRNGARRHGVIAAKIDRKTRSFAKFRRLLVERPGPGNIGAVIPQYPVGRGEAANLRRAQISVVDDRMAEFL